MGRIAGEEAEREAVMAAAKLMAAAARTAPKTRGLDSVQTLILDGEDLEALAAAMEAKPQTKAHRLPFFARDAGNVRKSAAVLLIGVTGEPKKPEDPLNCGGCGNRSCAEFIAGGRQEGEDYQGPLCLFQAVDLGIAVASAVKVASDLNIDNRIMYTVGAAARQLGLLQSDVVLGLPLSVSGKSPYFDR